MAVNRYYSANPKENPPNLTYQRVLVERAVDAAGVPGAFAQIADIAIDASDLYTEYTDTSGASTDWYRHRWANTALTSFSGYSDALQAGDSQMRQWIRADIPDADLTATIWNRWIEQALVDLYAFGLWKWASAVIVPTTTSGVADTLYEVSGAIRDVVAVEQIGTDGLTHYAWLSGNEFSPRGRELYLPYASTSYQFKVWGKARYQTVGELTDEGYMLLYHMVRAKYLQYRENQRANYRKFILTDRDSDVTPEQIRAMKVDAQAEVEKRIRALAFSEPAIPVASSGPMY